MLYPPIRVVASFALPLVAAAGVTAVSLATRDTAEAEPTMFVSDAPAFVVERLPAEESAEVAPEWSPADFSFVIRAGVASYIRLSDDVVEPRGKTVLVVD